MARKNYRGDVTDKEWSEIEPLICEGLYRGAGCKGKYSKREKFNAILYVLRTGCQWTDLPHDFPPWKTVYVGNCGDRDGLRVFYCTYPNKRVDAQRKYGEIRDTIHFN